MTSVYSLFYFEAFLLGWPTIKNILGYVINVYKQVPKVLWYHLNMHNFQGCVTIKLLTTDYINSTLKGEKILAFISKMLILGNKFLLRNTTDFKETHFPGRENGKFSWLLIWNRRLSRRGNN